MAVRLVRWLRAVDSSPHFTPAQASAMAIIIHAEGISPSSLAALEGVKRPTLSRLIAGMEAADMIEKRCDPQDARAVMLYPTETGRTLWREGQKRIVAPLSRKLSHASECERKAIVLATDTLAHWVNVAVAGDDDY